MNSAFAVFATAALLCSVAFSTHNSIDFINEIRTYEVELPISLSGKSATWRTWAYQWIGTRLATGTDSNKNIYIGCSSSSHDGYVFKVDATNRSEIISEHKFSGFHVIGLYVHPDWSYGVLLWDSVNSTHKIYVAKVDKNNKEVWRTELYNEYVIADSFWVGDGRFEYGNGEYRAYYHVHGASGYMEGHEGDAYYTVNKTGHPLHVQPPALHPDTNAFLSVCNSDAYPGLGVYTEDRNLIYNAPGNMYGRTAAELGGAAIGFNGTWLIVFNAPKPERRNSSYDKSAGDQEIVLGFIGQNKKKTSVKYLTDTPGVNEDDSCIAVLGNETQQYLVGWKAGSDYMLGVINGEGEYIINPVNVTGITKWGNRDDSFRTSENNGSVFWLYAPDDKGNKIIITTIYETFDDALPSYCSEKDSAASFNPFALLKFILMLF